jgi:tight adherence protein B
MKRVRVLDQDEQAVLFYREGWRRKSVRAIGACLIWFSAGYLFYNSVWISAALSIAGGAVSMRDSRSFLRARKRVISIQFEQALQSISSSLHAGKSMENALKTAASDLTLMYSQHKPPLADEFERVSRMVEHGIALEQALDMLRRRLQIPDVSDWVDVFRTCKRSGGDLMAVMRHTSRAIGEKMDLERELAVIIAGKRFEADLLSVIPLLLLAALRFGSPEYMAPLYHGLGRVIMTLAFATMVGCIILSRRLMRFEW